jgi:Uma2 family endonuclease
MTADEFIAWAMTQPGRYELMAGEVVTMVPERAVHARTKAGAHRHLEGAIALAGVACEAFPDGMSVRIDETTIYEPDALVRCGARLPDEATELDDPVVVVEVLSPSTHGTDSGAKLQGYFGLPSVRHYLILNTASRAATHHRRDDGRIVTAILREGELTLDPPGIMLRVEDLFGAG